MTPDQSLEPTALGKSRFAAQLQRRPFMRTSWFAASFFAAHFISSVGALLWSFTTSAAHFDGRHVSWLSRNLSGPAFEILWFPLSLLDAPPRVLPGLWGYLPTVLNSALWTAIVVLCLRKAGWTWGND